MFYFFQKNRINTKAVAVKLRYVPNKALLKAVRFVSYRLKTGVWFQIDNVQ